MTRVVMLARRAAGYYRPRNVVFRRGLRDRMRVSRIVHEICGGIVQRGPFRGMRCLPVLPDTSAKVLGSYEDELHAELERILTGDFDTVVNIGSSDGYYAVGCALRLARPGVHAFDLSSHMQELTQATAALNGMDVQVHGQCTPEQLEAIIAGARPLVICDCEGCEYTLLDPERATSLACATLVVELHDEPGGDLPGRFAATHRLTTVVSRRRNPADYPELTTLNEHDRRLAVFERPAEQQWVVFEPVEGRT